MTHRARIRRRRVAALLIAGAAVAAALGYQSPESTSSTAAPPRVLRSEPSGAPGAPDRAAAPRRERRERPAALANLDPALLGALRQAAADAAAAGIELVVESGWRSPEHQERLLDEAVAKHGSEAEAARWVATPETSPHVSGDAIDIGPSAATAWLSRHGARYGLCQIYENEPWHFEFRPQAIDHGCPPMYADPTHDPRMHR